MGEDKQTDEQTKVPLCVLQDFVHFKATALSALKGKKTLTSRKSSKLVRRAYYTHHRHDKSLHFKHSPVPSSVTDASISIFS